MNLLLKTSLFIVYLIFSPIDAALPISYRNIKRSSKEAGGCVDPTEPFQCLGSTTCISLQFLCDGQPGDCPNNSDENEALCLALKRPPKDSIKRFLLAQYYTSNGKHFIGYLFGAKATMLFKKEDPATVVDAIATALIVSPNIDQFANVFEMTEEEKNRLTSVLKALHTGQNEDLPKYIHDSISQGLNTLTEKLIKTNFLKPNNEK